MEWPLFVEREYVVGAWRLIYLLRVAKIENQAWQMVAKKPPLQLERLGLVGDVSGGIRLHYNQVWEPVRRAVSVLVYEAMGRYLYLRFLLSVKGFGPMLALAFLASPPDVTLKRAGPIVKPSGYINVNFIPVVLKNGRIHRPILARFFYSNAVASITLRRYLTRENPQTRAVYERNMKKYVERGYPETRAKRLAFRDALRVVIGCAWLVRVHELLDDGLIEPSDVILPYRAMTEKIEAGELIDPHYLVEDDSVKSRLEEYTWRRLIEKIKR